ncbi:PAS domain S-box protein [Cereibacter sphaeroides]|uniref:PAS domain S-box protein n=1 Tax=Cereibacter sphaeroides TaxID=1063 RepID=UPI002D7F1CBB|nr:PAS domain S-box protein [Cereibacter sphaeroides]MCE6968674.1 PAS domain S-box protein [Cereibacter sphaeroides]
MIDESSERPVRIHLADQTAREILRAARDAVVVIDLSARIIFFNAAAERMFGYTARQVIGRPLDLLIPEESRERHRQRLRLMRMTGIAPRQAHTLGRMQGRRADGSRFPMDIAISRAQSPDGPVFMAMVRSLSAQAQALDPGDTAAGHHKGMVEGPQHLIWTCGPDGDCDYISPQWADYTGVAAEELLGMGWAALIHPKDCEQVVETWYDCVKRGAAHECEFRLRRRDGTFRWFHSLAVPLRDGQGLIRRWHGSTTEVDDLRRSPQRPARHDETLAFAVEAGQVGVWEADLLTGAVRGNARHDFIFGYDTPPPSWSIDAAERHVLEEDRAIFRDACRKAGVIGMIDIEVRIRDTHGCLRRIALRGQLAQQPGRLLGTITDITDRKDASGQAHLQAVVRSMDDALITTGVDGAITSWNPGAERLLGWTEEEIVGRSIMVLVPDDLRTDGETRWRDHAKGLASFAFETRRLHKNGTSIEVSVVVSPIRDEAGRFVGLAGVLRERRADRGEPRLSA